MAAIKCQVVLTQTDIFKELVDIIKSFNDDDRIPVEVIEELQSKLNTMMNKAAIKHGECNGETMGKSIL